MTDRKRTSRADMVVAKAGMMAVDRPKFDLLQAVGKAGVDPRARFFGRRLGKKLSERQAGLWESLLPRHGLTPAALTDEHFWRSYNHWWLEIGFGGGENIYRWACDNPTTGFIGAEPFRPAVAKLLVKLEEGGDELTNLRLYADDVWHIFANLPPRVLDKIVILYPDPWPKQRHAARRMVSSLTLPIFRRVLKIGGQVVFATDQPILLQSTMRLFQADQYFRWLNGQVDAAGPQWLVRPSFMLPSRYEMKSQRLGGVNVDGARDNTIVVDQDKSAGDRPLNIRRKFGAVPVYLIYEKIAEDEVG
ncbi:MAG: tRNA (guanine(46)-N(7))-methyltransferase TrmB [Alphaproteobacteria bacterium]|nr:tRNA (guanine(46)-N(7))-methyltransferase TrmB [Alphaproteobacteria bacterium]